MIFSKKQLEQLRATGANFYPNADDGNKRGVTKDGEAISLVVNAEKYRTLQPIEDFEYSINQKNFCMVMTDKSRVVVLDDDSEDKDKVKIPKGLTLCTERDKITKKSLHYYFIADTDEDVEKFAVKDKAHPGLEVFTYHSSNVICIQGHFRIINENSEPKRTWYLKGGDMELSREFPILKFSDLQIPKWGDTVKSKNTKLGEITKPEKWGGVWREDDFIITEGQNRGKFLLCKMSLNIRNDPSIIHDNKKFRELINRENEKHCSPPLEGSKLESVIKMSSRYTKDDNFDFAVENPIPDLIPDVSDMIDVTNPNYEIPREHYSDNDLADKDKDADKRTKYETLDSLRFAHITKTFEDQFHSFVWDNKTWRVDSHNIIFQIMKHFDKLYTYSVGEYEFETIKMVAKNTEAVGYVNSISANLKTIKVDVENHEYQKLLQLRLTDNAGHYHDIVTGEIKNVDPTNFFFRNNMFNFDLTKVDDIPPRILELFDGVIPNEYQRKCFIDTMASVLLPINEVLDGRVKMTYMVGPKWTYKTTICDTFQSIFNSDFVCNVKTEEMGDKFAISMLGDCYLNIIDETNNEAVTNPAAMKEIITLKKRKADVKNAKTQKIFHKFPRHFVPCNIMPPIPLDDNADALFDRMAIIQFTKTDNPKWGKIINTPIEIQRLAKYLLKRATQIYKDQTMQYQDVKQIRSLYDGLIGGDMEEFLDKYYIKDSEGVIGSYASLMKSGYETYTGDKLSYKAFNQILDSLKITKDDKYNRSSGYRHGDKFGVLYLKAAAGEELSMNYERNLMLVHGYHPNPESGKIKNKREDLTNYPQK